MSLYEFQKKNTPSVPQSLFRREIGLVGICGHYGKETTNTNDNIIHRQLIQSRAPRSPLPPPPPNSNVKLRKPDGSSRSDSDDGDGRIKREDITRNLQNRLLVEEWSRPENSHVLILHGKIFIRSGRTTPYIAHEVDLGLGQIPVLRCVYRIPSVSIWSGWEVWWHSVGSQGQEHSIRQHGILFVVEKPGHVLQSFHFDSGKTYKTIHLDPTVEFKSLELSTETLLLNSVKASVGAECDHAVVDFIILNCPDLQLVTRCRITKAAVENSTVEIHGEFIFLINGRRIEVFDLKETIKSSYKLLDPSGYAPAEGVTEGIPCTHFVLKKPVCLYAVGDTSHSHLELGTALWPPHYVKRNKLEKFQVLPMSESSQLSSGMLGVDFLNLVDDIVPHDEDNLCFHPDESGRLIVTGHTEIRVILLNRQNEFGTITNTRTHFTVQFSKSLTKPTPEVPEVSRRSGLRAVRRQSYVADISDEDRGIIRWDYCFKLDIFVILEFSSTTFYITMLDNQSWQPIALINLSDSLQPKKNYLNCDTDFVPCLFSIDVTDGFILIRRNSKTAKQVKKLFIVNLLSDER